MKYSRILLSVACMALVGGVAGARENAMGVRVGYNTRNSSPTAGLWFQHEFAPHFRLAPNVDYIFRHDNSDALSINCNGQFPFHFGQYNAFVFYPLAGINYTSWNYHHSDDPADSSSDGDGDVTSRNNRFGFNAGAGLEYRVTPTLKLALEAKGTLVKSYSSATISVSIGYVF
ncbi:MAG: porin family protein [Bacteroidales bacterium]|nr:porin family protein [Bacteroidales bacterium]MBD5235872.1 porin family protein [Barnesiella sp.]